MHAIVPTFELYSIKKFSKVALLKTMILVTYKMFFEHQKSTVFSDELINYGLF